jgi:hypothetical protein
MISRLICAFIVLGLITGGFANAQGPYKPGQKPGMIQCGEDREKQ